MKPILIAGPCSAESLEQVLAAADAVAGALCTVAASSRGPADALPGASAVGPQLTYFRAGLWKPRTMPGSFEGVGGAGLEWLAEVKRRYGWKVCCEVASASHVEACLKAGIDMVWIGARTTANPFQVQEIAESLCGVEIPVYAKNPVSHDLNLWCGAVERLSKCGVARIGAIHRGVSSNSSLEYRNDPAWDLAIEFHSRYPELPLLCDPSHIAGKAESVPELSQRAINIGFDGLMVEVHNDPSKALSDAAQQLSPEGFSRLLGNLVIRDGVSSDVKFIRQIEQFRARIDDIDGNLLSLLGQRMSVSEEIGCLKKESNVAILQSGRWEEVLSRAVALGRRNGLSENFVRTIFTAIHEESIHRQ